MTARSPPPGESKGYGPLWQAARDLCERGFTAALLVAIDPSGAREAHVARQELPERDLLAENLALLVGALRAEAFAFEHASEGNQDKDLDARQKPLGSRVFEPALARLRQALYAASGETGAVVGSTHVLLRREDFERMARHDCPSMATWSPEEIRDFYSSPTLSAEESAAWIAVMREEEPFEPWRTPGRLHELRCHSEPFAAVKAGVKTFEVRKDDRGYAAGDVLHLFETSPETGERTGDSVVRRVTYKLSGGAWGLPEEICVLGLAKERAP